MLNFDGAEILIHFELARLIQIVLGKCSWQNSGTKMTMLSSSL